MFKDVTKYEAVCLAVVENCMKIASMHEQVTEDG